MAIESSAQDRSTSTAAASGKPIQVAAMFFLSAAMVQVFILTAGWHGWPQYTDDFRLLADGFRHGQLSLVKQPPRGLLALRDPYDPHLNGGWALHDAVLFNRKYYLYWGPVPALILAAIALPMNGPMPEIGDQLLVLPFLIGTTMLATVLIFQIRRRLFPEQPVWSAGPAILSLGLGTPLLFTLARAAAYEAAIAAAQFFLLAGILAAWRGMQSARRQSIWFALAGVWWALCIGSRVSFLPATLALAGLAVWQTRWSRAIALFTPLIAAALALGWYNHARFGSVTEFGLLYQLASQNQHATYKKSFFSIRYVLVNLHRYVLTPPHAQAKFPFFLPSGGGPPTWAQDWHFPPGYGFEAVVGVVWTQPFLLLGLLACAVPWWGRMRRTVECGADRPLLVWLTLTLVAAIVLGFGPTLMVEGSTMRYLMDVIPCATLLSAVGYWQLRRSAGPGWSTWISAVAWSIAGGESMLGFLMGLTGYYNHFINWNPACYRAIARIFTWP